MSEHKEESESLIEKISDKIHGHDDSSSSSDSDNEKSAGSSAAAPAKGLEEKVFRLFGRETPVHTCMGGGKRTILILLIFFII